MMMPQEDLCNPEIFNGLTIIIIRDRTVFNINNNVIGHSAMLHNAKQVCPQYPSEIAGHLLEYYLYSDVDDHILCDLFAYISNHSLRIQIGFGELGKKRRPIQFTGHLPHFFWLFCLHA